MEAASPIGEGSDKRSLCAKLYAFGFPPDLRVEPQDSRPLGKKEVRVEMFFSPINPADINILEGKYGLQPELPSRIGNEGIGRVVEIGEAVGGVRVGDFALPLNRQAWANHLVAATEKMIFLDQESYAGIDLQQLAMLSVNPLTAYAMLTTKDELKRGDWIVQNAANSGVGRSVIQIASLLGFRTLNIVRRKELVKELYELGADVVTTEETDLRKEIKNLTAGHRAKLALNAVGGASALNLANALVPGSRHLTYGAMGRQALKIPNGLLLFQQLRFEGFWMTPWLEKRSSKERNALFQKLATWVKEEKLVQPIHSIYALENLSEAVKAAYAEQRKGKILLDLQKTKSDY
ncbi:MAG: MDR family NADPH-dependent oxidoreductase [Chthoniobacterales bacterium]